MTCQKAHTSTAVVSTWVQGKNDPSVPRRNTSHVPRAACPITAARAITASELLLLHPLGCIDIPKCTATRSGRAPHALVNFSSRAATMHQITVTASLPLMTSLRDEHSRAGIGPGAPERNQRLRRSPIPLPARRTNCLTSGRRARPATRPKSNQKENLFHDFSITPLLL